LKENNNNYKKREYYVLIEIFLKCFVQCANNGISRINKNKIEQNNLAFNITYDKL